jgi:hypothetical protein
VQVSCKACGAPIDATGEAGFAKCRFCGALVRLADASGARRTAPETVPRPPLTLPRGVTVLDTGARLTIVRRWFHWSAIVLAAFAALWIGLLAFFYAMISRSGAPAFVFLFPLLHVGVGVVLAYFAAALFLNRTVVEVGDGRLRVRHGPLPWRRAPTLAVSEVSQVFVREDRHKDSDGGSQRTYSVHVVSKDGGRTKLLGTVIDAEHALFVEQRIERHLGIADRAVPGELPRE